MSAPRGSILAVGVGGEVKVERGWSFGCPKQSIFYFVYKHLQNFTHFHRSQKFVKGVLPSFIAQRQVEIKPIHSQTLIRRYPYNNINYTQTERQILVEYKWHVRHAKTIKLW